MIHAGPPGREPLRPVHDPALAVSRNAAQQRRAMQAAMANAVRAMRSTPAHRRRPRGSGDPPPGTLT